MTQSHARRTFRIDVRGHRVTFALALTVLISSTISTTSVDAQELATARGFSVEPRLGWFWDSREDAPDADFASHAGRFGAVRLSKALAPRLRAVASAGYARMDDAFTGTVVRSDDEILTVTMRREYLPVTAGLELDVAGERTAIAIGLEAGAAWYRSPVTNRTGPPPFIVPNDALSREWDVDFAFLPSVTVRQSITRRLTASLTAQSFNNLSSFERGAYLETPVLVIGVAWSIR